MGVVLVGVLVLALGCGPGGAPALADDSAVAITGVQTSVGRVEFFLAARDLPGGTPLAKSTVTVRVGETTLASTVRAVATAGGQAPRRAVVLVLDASGSMAGARLRAARAAALDYAATAPPDVWLGLVTVSSTPASRLAPTADRDAFRSAVARIGAGGRTALYDGILLAERMLDPAGKGRAGRQPAAPVARDADGQVVRFAERRVVALSDGADTASTVTADDLARRLAKADATVDVVAFGEAETERLAALTAATGGRVLPAAGATALRGIFRAMAAQLSAPVIVSATVPPVLAGRAATLRVEVTGSGGTVAGSARVRFPVDPAAARAPRTFQAGGAGGGSLPIAVGALAVGLFLAVLLAVPASGRNEVQRRLSQLDRFSMGRRGGVALPPPPPTGGAAGGQVLKAALAVSERAVRRPDRRERIELALDRAGSQLRAAEWQLVRISVAAGAALLLALVFPWWAGLPLGALCGWLGTGQYLRTRAGRRTRRFADQLPEALQLVVGSLRSGFSLAQSIDALVREGAEPVASELGRALAETRLGGDLEDALERVGERNASQDMIWLVMAIRIQREVGGNLSETLETAVHTMRERGRLTRHVRTLSAEGRLSALVLLGMPIVLGGWMFAFRRDYLRPLYTEPLGVMMLVGAVVMVGVGALWLRKLVQVEV